MPLLNELRQLRGEQALDSAQFFRPNLAVAPPQKRTATAKGINSQDAAKKLHRFYLAALAKIIKGVDVEANLKIAATVIDRLYAVAEGETLRRLLWVSQAFIEALADHSIELDSQGKPPLGKLEQQIKLIGRKGESALVEESLGELLQAMLYQIAQSGAAGDYAASVRLAFDLDRLLPGSSVGPGGLNAELKQTVSADIMEELTRVKDSFDIFVRSDRRHPESLAELADSLGNIAETLSMLQEESLRQTLLQQVAVIRQLVSGEQESHDDILMGVAGAVLAVESALCDWGNSAPVVKADASEEQVDDAENSPQAIAEHQRVTRQVMKEAKDDLTRIREAINNYLENSQDKTILQPLPVMLHNIIGSLTMLSYKRVAQILVSVRAFIEHELISGDAIPEQTRLDALADAVMSVEYYLEAFIQSRVHPGTVLDVAESAVEALGYPCGTVVETDILTAEQGPDLTGIEVIESAEQFDVEAEEQALTETDSAMDETPAVAEAETAQDVVAEQVAASAEKLPTTPAAERASTGVEVDDEILEIFIEEAEEELESISQMLPAWSRDPSDEESLKTLRRSFHTLKGSGRLVGALEVGEFAWAFENMLNRVIDGAATPTATMFDLLEQALEVLPELIEQFRSGKTPEADAEMLRQMATEIIEPGGLKLTEPAVSEAAQGGTAAEQETKPAASVEQAAEAVTAEIPQLDPALLEIYAKEAEGHLQELERFIAEWREGGSHKVSEPLIRALHTLQGSSRMAGVMSVADVCVSLEKYAKTLQASHQGVEAEGIDALASCLEYVRAMLAYLAGGGGGRGENVPDSTAARAMADAVYAGVQHLEHAASAQPEAGLARQEEKESFEFGQLPATEAATPSRQAEMPATEAAAGSSGEEGYDQDLLDIFLEEGRDILDASEETLQAWVDSPDDRSLIESLQRQLHTLKGGARMAGIKAIGDLSHSLESTFEAVEEGRLERTPQMLDLLQLSHDRLVAMLEQVSNHEPVVDGDDLIRQVEVLGQGGELQPETAAAADETPAQAGQQESASEVLPRQINEERLAAVEKAIAELELNHSSWLRNVDNQSVFDQLINSAVSLSSNSAESNVEELLNIAVAVQRLLEAIRDGHVPASKKVNDMLSLVMDCMHLIIKQCRQQVALDNGDFLISDIDELIRRGIAEEEAISPEEVEEERVREPAEAARLKPVAETRKASAVSMAEAEDNKRHGGRIQHEMVRVRADLLDNLVNFAGEVSIYRSRVEQQIGAFGSNIDEMDQTVDRLRAQVRQFEIENEAQIESRREEAQKQGYEDFDPLEFDRFTHMQQLSRSMAESLNDLLSIEEILTGLTRETETLLLQQSRVNTELQESLVHTRMVPLVENAPRLRRIVRQISSELGKRATLRFEGAEVEMDRNVVERMMAPLEHMLRNAIAHGIEEGAVRKKAGKPEGGDVTIALSREGSEIVIRVRDDGAGIPVETVRQKAVERGLMKADSRLSDKEIIRFILESGFSTAESLSQISGRGVGMDVVNSEIKQLGGVMDIDTVPGQGTTFSVRIPLTLSVSRALLVEVADDTYAIPLLSISGIERIEASELEQLLASEAPTFSWVGEEYDLMHLTNVLDAGQGVVSSELTKQPLLLARSGDSRIAFAVDNLIGSREIVVKSLGPQLSTLHELAGATILADGNVALIIDMPALIRRGLAHKSRADAGLVTVAKVEKEPVVMVVDDSITVRKVTERLLKRHNMRCITAKDGVDALAALEENIPDVMLLDIEMPRMDGFELATHMRNSGQLKDIPIIMITSRTGDKHRQRAMDIGVNVYLGKPYTEVDLLENIEALMKHSQSTAND
ncbi:MAG: Hpt domain-containing protein [Gammaproteobacteria bacterium]|nr:Hpt domain-containing protein [Gammaproteobacteria bacterium]